VGASDLIAADVNGKSDPYVVWFHDDDPQRGRLTGKSMVSKANLNPTWNMEITLNVSDNDILRFEIWDEDKIGKDDFLGYIEVAVNKLVPSTKDEKHINKLPCCSRPGKNDKVKGTFNLIIVPSLSSLKVAFNAFARPNGSQTPAIRHEELGKLFEQVQGTVKEIKVSGSRLGPGFVSLYDDNGSGFLEYEEVEALCSQALPIIKASSDLAASMKIDYINIFGEAALAGKVTRDKLAIAVVSQWASLLTSHRRERFEVAKFDETLKEIVNCLFVAMGAKGDVATSKELRDYLWKQEPAGELSAEIRKLFKVPLRKDPS